MSKPHGENPTESESYVAWLEACDQAIALGRAPIESIPAELSPEREHETLDLRAKTANVRRKFEREHGHGAVGKVDAGAAQVSFVIEG